MVRRVLLVVLAAWAALPALGQAASQPRENAGAAVPALFLSDIHLDPYHDPAKVARLNAAPAAEWPEILGAPDSPTRDAAALRLSGACATRGSDTSDLLWRSSLRAMHTEAAAAPPRFVALSGDLLAHAFDCKYKALLPKASHADYAAFTEKTVRYVLSGLRAAIPNTPIYLALGNNDSSCTDYQLAPEHDEFLAMTAKVAAEMLPEADRAAVRESFGATGSYAVPLAGVPNTEMIVLDDLYLSAHYAACGGGANPKPSAAELTWLRTELAAARDRHERVWVMGHIPPGIDLYTTARKLTDVCGGGRPAMFLSSTALGETLAQFAGTVRLALFGHTHSDEMGLLVRDASSEGAPAGGGGDASPVGVPVRLTASISPVNGNRPTFTMARIDPATADLKDFTVYIASNDTGVHTAWTREYTFSAAYQLAEYDGESMRTLIAGFQADAHAETAASKAYLRDYFPGDASTLLQFAWPEYTCGMDHASPQAFAACLCRSKTQP